MSLEPFIYQSLAGDSPKAHEFQAFQDMLDRAIMQFVRKPQLDSLFITRSISLSAGVENWVEHGLGRAIIGWHVVDQDTPAVIYRVATSAANLSQYLPLAVTQAVNIRLVVF